MITLQLWLIAVSIIDLLIVEFVININKPHADHEHLIIYKVFSYGYFTMVVRPILFVLSIRSVKQFWGRYMNVIRGSFPMVMFILLYVFYFAWIGNRIFAGTIEGIEYFSTLYDSFFFMFVLLTTSNYPDIMLPSY